MVKLYKEVEPEKDVSETMISADDMNKKEEKDLFGLFSMSLTVDNGREMEISGATEEFELEKTALEIDASSKGVELGKEAEQKQDVIEAVLVLEQIQIEEKISSDQSKIEPIVDKKEKSNHQIMQKQQNKKRSLVKKKMFQFMRLKFLLCHPC